MVKLELVSVETDTKKVYKVADNFVFTLTLDVLVPIAEDIVFEVSYFGNAYSDQHDQRIGYNVLGPLEPGKQYFQLETSPIDLTKIPIKTLFGLTTILVVGKYLDQQFIRIGYVVNVQYPGVSPDQLLDSDDQPMDEFDGEEASTANDEEEVSVMNDDELDDEEDGDEEGDGDEEADDDEEDDGDDEDLVAEDDGENEDGTCHHSGLEDVLTKALLPKIPQKPIPLETSIVAGKDEFEYRGIHMKQSKIEMVLLEKPIIHVYTINWKSESDKKDEQEVVESSEENDKNRDAASNSEDFTAKKARSAL